MAFCFIILFLYWPLPIKLQYVLVKCILPVVGPGNLRVKLRPHPAALLTILSRQLFCQHLKLESLIMLHQHVHCV